MLTSVIIPTYNRAHLLPRAIRSILGQSSQSWELIIVDDGSTDSTKEVVAQFLHNNKIQYLHKPNSGAAHSRNVGAALAKGDLITFLDSDDEALPSWLEKMASTIDEKQGVVCCGLERVDYNGKLIDVLLPVTMEPMFKNVTARFTNGGAFLMKLTIFLAIGGFDGDQKSGQHTEMAFRLIPYLKQKGILIANIMEPLIRIHIHKGARIRFNANSIFLGTERILTKHGNLFVGHPNQYVVFLSMAGVAGIKTGRYAEATGYLWKAVKTKPLRATLWLRLILSRIPFVRDIVWRSTKLE